MKRPRDFQTMLGGVLWSIHFVRKGHPKVPGSWGMCYWEPREIYVRYDMAPKTVRMVLVHEMIHATCRLMFVAEEWVDHTASELADGLTKGGF